MGAVSPAPLQMEGLHLGQIIEVQVARMVNEIPEPGMWVPHKLVGLYYTSIHVEALEGPEKGLTMALGVDGYGKTWRLP